MSCYAIIPIQQIKLQCYMTRPRVTTKPLAETDNSNPTLHHSCMITENRVAHTHNLHKGVRAYTTWLRRDLHPNWHEKAVVCVSLLCKGRGQHFTSNTMTKDDGRRDHAYQRHVSSVWG